MISMVELMKMTKQTLKEEKSFRDNVLSQLSERGTVGAETEIFLRNRNVLLKFHRQKHSAAAWTLNGNIQINHELIPKSIALDNPTLLSLVVHEARHLQQGILTALSVYGELDAWQVGFRFYQEMTGAPLNPVLQEILTMPLNWSRTVLKEAAILMKRYSPGYRIDLLPLYPIQHEIAWWISRKEPK